MSQIALADRVRPSQPLSDRRNAYLQDNVKIEPLVDRWTAWPHLLAPVPQALNLAFRYLPMAKSFAQSPSVHVAAARSPALFGGPFLALPETAADEVRNYVESTTARRAGALELAHTLREFDRQLQESADGFSLDAHRGDVPGIMRGLVELAYDIHNAPRTRLLEEMFIGNDFGVSSAQEVLLHRQPDVDRPFFLSTPRLSLDGGLFIQAPFGSEAIRALCEARRTPTDIDALAQRLGVDASALSGFFGDTQGAATTQRYAGEGVRVRYFGHASVLIETNDLAILVDPTAANDPPSDTHHFWRGDLPAKIDVVVLSHSHQDHCCIELLMQLRDRIDVIVIPPNNRGNIADPSLKMMLESLGYKNIVTLDLLGQLPVKGGVLTSLPFNGEHCDLDVDSKQCLLVELLGRKIGVFVDSDAIDIDVYARLAPRLQGVDVMLLGMECFGAPLSWLYGPLLPKPVSSRNDNSRRLSGANCERASRLFDLIRPKRAYVYAMGQEPWMRHMMGLNYRPDSIQLQESDAFIAACVEKGAEAARLMNHMELVL